jgi:hypothetical protein
MCSGGPAHVDPWADRAAQASLNCCRRITHASPDPEACRPADPGAEVDQSAAVGPKVRQTVPWWRCCIGSGQRTGHGKLRRIPLAQGRSQCRSQGRLSSCFVRLCVKSGCFVTSGQNAVKDGAQIGLARSPQTLNRRHVGFDHGRLGIGQVRLHNAVRHAHTSVE